MRLVSSQSEAEMQRRETRENLAHPLRVLTANLLRIANGAGQPWLLMKQLEACTAAISAYVEAHGALPSETDFHAILDCDAVWREFRPLSTDTEDKGHLEQIPFEFIHNPRAGNSCELRGQLTCRRTCQFGGADQGLYVPLPCAETP